MKTMNINGDMTFLCLDQTIFLKDIFSNQIFCDKKQKLEDNLRDWRDIWRELVQENSFGFLLPAQGGYLFLTWDLNQEACCLDFC